MKNTMKHKAVTKATGLRRLLKLAEFVSKQPRDKFEFSHFVGDDWKGAPDLSCGTSACAMGWATAMPYFRKLGLHLSRRGTYARHPVLKRQGNFEKIIERLFGFSAYEANKLFIPGNGFGNCNDGPATPKAWARYARKFVARKRL